MNSINACGVSKEDGKMWLVLSERKNPKFPIGTSFSVDSDPSHADYMVFKANNLPNRFFLKKVDFIHVFGASYEEYRESKIEKMKNLAAALVKVMKENGSN